jgi:hypothetical protein
MFARICAASVLPRSFSCGDIHAQAYPNWCLQLATAASDHNLSHRHVFRLLPPPLNLFMFILVPMYSIYQYFARKVGTALDCCSARRGFPARHDRLRKRSADASLSCRMMTTWYANGPAIPARQSGGVA